MYRKFDVTGNLILHSALFSASKHSLRASSHGHGVAQMRCNAAAAAAAQRDCIL
jgi:hypothetical protein